ncbi:MAG: hypothetical protein F6K55_25790 [Moorea sp. SIO4A3]|nr:hypothetical protein [Moorena sp. SIO4A3]
MLNNGIILRVFWNGHVGGMGILPVPIPGGQDAHSTHNRTWSALPISLSPYSLFVLTSD